MLAAVVIWVAREALKSKRALPLLILGGAAIGMGYYAYRSFRDGKSVADAHPCRRAAVLALDDVLKGPRSLLALALVPMAVGSSEIATGWPIWLALNRSRGVGPVLDDHLSRQPEILRCRAAQ